MRRSRGAKGNVDGPGQGHRVIHEKASAQASALRSLAIRIVADGFFRGLSRAGRLHPDSRPAAHDIEVIRDVPYSPGADPSHRLDVYRPMRRAGPLPVVLYIHGGGFHLLSKETHWVMGLVFARAGYLVCNIEYRKPPRHPFPGALEDACDALCWLSRHVAEYGGDPARVVLAGESAGANLAASVAIATSYRRPEPYAGRVWDTGLVPRALALGCGLLQVSDPGRFARRRKLPWWVRGMIEDISAGYLAGAHESFELADPLCVLESGRQPERPLPPVFAFVGTRDPVLDDTRRLEKALGKLGVEHDVRYYPGELHAFHAFPVRRAARECWRAKLEFLARHVDANRVRFT